MPQPEYATEAIHAKVDELVAPYIGSPANVGLVVEVLCGDERHVFGYGQLTRDRDATPDEHTVFEIGSITKVFTANLLADMVARGEVKLDDPVRKYLPPSVRVPTWGGEEITLLHLATHTASLPRMPGNWEATVKDQANPYADYTVEHLYQYLGSCRLRWPLGTRADYSNLGVGLLGHALALAAGRPYEELLLERVARPLGLNDTSITLSEDQRRRLAPGHAEDGKPTANWDIPTLAGAGALRSSVSEMLSYLDANLRPDATPLKTALEACHVAHPLRRTAWMRVRPFLIAVYLVALGLTLQGTWPVPPGSYTFFALFVVPIVLSAMLGGLWSGLTALALSVVGSRLLWGEGFDGIRAATVSLVPAVVFSVGHWFPVREVFPGWQFNDLGGGARLFWHNGGTGGYRSFVGFVRESRCAVAVLSNSANGVDAIGVGLLEHLHTTNAVWSRVRRVYRRWRPSRGRPGDR
jgi:CubicO group peptidase (beta-lactamase class C family)